MGRVLRVGPAVCWFPSAGSCLLEPVEVTNRNTRQCRAKASASAARSSVFGALTTVEGAPPDVLAEVAREFSPRIETCSHTEIVLDLNGLTRLFGDGRTMAEELRRTAGDRGLRVRVAIAGTRTAARLLVRHRAGLTIVEPGNESAAVAPLPIALLADLLTTDLGAPGFEAGARDAGVGARELRTSNPRSSKSRRPQPGARSQELIATFRRWGLRTLGDLAALPSDDLAARLGHQEADWQRLARGEDLQPLVPAVPEERFEQTLDLEWPIEDLEPLSFVLGRLMEPLEAHLEQRDRGAAVLHVRLHLIKTDGAARAVHERSLQLPVPIRDARTLRTLALLDLESNPPAAAIDRVTVAVDPTPARIVQFSLLTRPLPSPEQISTLMARLYALMGEARCGSPAPVDSWAPGACAMNRFMPPDLHALRSRAAARHRHPAEPGVTLSLSEAQGAPGKVEGPGSVEVKNASNLPVVALRRFRHPVPIRVHVVQGRPASVSTMPRGLSGGAVEACAGPWRTSGGWWTSGIREPGTVNSERPEPRAESPKAWDRDEWDVALTGGPTCRLFRERNTDRWFLEGVVD
jgi:protein ImuB